MGKFKWEKLGVKYELENVRDANSDDVHYPSAKCIYDIVYSEKMNLM